VSEVDHDRDLAVKMVGEVGTIRGREWTERVGSSGEVIEMEWKAEESIAVIYWI
jgi:hypothetical protein